VRGYLAPAGQSPRACPFPDEVGVLELSPPSVVS
jgi:hypothetical protein